MATQCIKACKRDRDIQVLLKSAECGSNDLKPWNVSHARWLLGYSCITVHDRVNREKQFAAVLWALRSVENDRNLTATETTQHYNNALINLDGLQGRTERLVDICITQLHSSEAWTVFHLAWSDEGVKVLTVSMSHETPAGICCNYTIWTKRIFLN